MRRYRPVGGVAVLLFLALVLAGCGGDDDAESGSPTTTEKSTPVIIEITEDNGVITPSDGHVVKVDVGQTIRLNVSSDQADEIHVHSDPEHEFEIGADEDKSFDFTIDSPGTYAVESHGLEITLVKLQVS